MGLQGDEFTETGLPPEVRYSQATGDTDGRRAGGFRNDGAFKIETAGLEVGDRAAVESAVIGVKTGDRRFSRLMDKQGRSGLPVPARNVRSEDDRPLVPLPDLAIFGDSFVEGFGINYSWPAWLRDYFLPETGDLRGVHPLGDGSQDASQIAARVGARDVYVTLTGDTMPASGSVVVTALDPLFITATSEPSIPMTIQGVAGMITRNGGGVLTFHRETPGVAFAVSPRSVGRADARYWQDCTAIIAAGRNTTDFDLTIIRQEVDALNAFQRTVERRSLIIGITNASQSKPDTTSSGYPDESAGSTRYSAMRAANDDLAFTYGDRFVDMHRYLVDRGQREAALLSAAGYFTPFALNWTIHAATYAAQDAADIAKDIVPTSLRTDGLHLNTFGAAVYAFAIFRRLRALGY